MIRLTRRFLPLVLLSTSLWLAASESVSSESVRRWAAQGNKAYRSGRYPAALDAYSKALRKAPDSPYLQFNEGAALYRIGDYAKAAEAFEIAAGKTSEPLLISRSKYNLGNCAFRQAEQKEVGELEKAMAFCRQSIGHYGQALKSDPDHNDAAENLEVARLYYRQLRDEQKRREKEKESNQQAITNATEKLKGLIKEQTEACDQTQALSQQRQMSGESNAWKDQLTQVSRKQQITQQHTQALAAEMLQRGRQTRQSSGDAHTEFGADLGKAGQHVQQAAQAEAAAIERLKQSEAARALHAKALEELQAALQCLTEQGMPLRDAGAHSPSQPQPSPGGAAMMLPGNDSQTGRNSGAPSTEQASGVLREEKTHRATRASAKRAWHSVERDW